MALIYDNKPIFGHEVSHFALSTQALHHRDIELARGLLLPGPYGSRQCVIKFQERSTAAVATAPEGRSGEQEPGHSRSAAQ